MPRPARSSPGAPRWWRFYDFMWGLHIMDLQTREDTHNPWVLGFGIASLVTTLLALILLPLTGQAPSQEVKALASHADQPGE